MGEVEGHFVTSQEPGLSEEKHQTIHEINEILGEIFEDAWERISNRDGFYSY